MPDSFAVALNQVGLITEAEQHEALGAQAQDLQERETALKEMDFTEAKQKLTSLLQHCPTISEFKDTARKLLTDRPGQIQTVIQAAQRFKEQEGGRNLIKLCYGVRDKMIEVPAHKREQFLRRAFRSAGSTLEIPL